MANEWDDLPLNEWGVAVWENMDNIDTSDSFTLPDGDKEPFQQMTFTLADAQAETIKEAIKKAKPDTVETFANENGNGNALYTIITQWAELKK